ncbi:MAG: phosphate ABC transporter substrate-binding protein PstS [Cyanobacteria bacterium J06592_8]
MLSRLYQINLSGLATKITTAALALTLAACGGGTDTAGTGGGDASGEGADVKLVLNDQVNLVGAGASFPAPLYQRWFTEFSQSTPNLQIDYQSVGSGAGVERFSQGLVQFGASDVAMKDEEIEGVERGVLMLPMTAGSIVLAYNVPGIDGELNLSRENYVNILLGNITNWNDPAIAETNPDLQLPDQPITVVYRSDGSGTTGVFTKHLSSISDSWQESVGEGKTVQWPVGIGGAKNDGVAAQISQTPGAIGYLEYGFAENAGLPMASLENQTGNYIKPTSEAASKTLAAVELPEDLRAFITDPEGEESYPIVTYTWLLAYQDYPDAEIAKSVEAMVEYGLNQGQKIAPQLGYIALPDNVRQKVAETADQLTPDYDITLE